MNELKYVSYGFSLNCFSYFYKEQKKVTRKGTEKSTQKPWKMETMMKLSPEYRVMIGNVVSMVVAPPTLIGASLPSICQQRSTQQGENLAADVGKKGDGSQFGAPVFGDEDTRKRVISES